MRSVTNLALLMSKDGLDAVNYSGLFNFDFYF